MRSVLRCGRTVFGRRLESIVLQSPLFPCILQWSDSEYWKNAPEYEAVYLHKFCVRREFAHREMTKSSKADIIQSCFKNNAVLWVFKMKCEEENLEIDTLTHL